MISNIHIKNFRSIRTADIDCTDITTFVGGNDAGKSNILRALNLFFNGETDPNHGYDHEHDFCKYAIIGKKKAEEVVIRLTLDLPENYKKKDYSSQVIWQKTWRQGGLYEKNSWQALKGLEPTKRNLAKEEMYFPRYSKAPALLSRIRYHYVPAIKDKRYFNGLQAEMYKALQYSAEVELRGSAGDFEQAIQVQLSELLGKLNIVLDQDTALLMPKNLSSIFESLEFNAEGIPFFRRGDGIKVRHIPSILGFIAEKNNSVLNVGQSHNIWGFEEPENNVEFIKAFEMAQEFIDHAKSNIQLMLTTHSPVFYGMSSIAKDINIYTYGVTQEDNQCTEINPADESYAHDLVGFLPIIAPLIHKEKLRWTAEKEQFEKERTIFQREIEEASVIKPKIFVEGPTDQRLMKRFLELKFPNLASNVTIYSGEEDGQLCSANSVSARARAWHLTQQTQASNRVRSFAILDKDEEGVRARGNIEKGLQPSKPNRRYAGVCHWTPSPCYLEVIDGALDLPIDLEATYSSEIWSHADANGWLEERSDWANHINRDTMTELSMNGLVFMQDWSKEQLLYKEMKFSNAGKIKATNYLLQLSNNEFCLSLEPIGVTLEEALKFIYSTDNLAELD